MKKISGIVLAGGKSLRMGRDKAYVEMGGKTMLEKVLHNLEPICDEIIIIANTPLKISTPYKVYKDIFENCGPLGGIHAGLEKSSFTDNIILSCDAPFVHPDVLEYLLENTDAKKCAVYRRAEKIYPFPGYYSRECLPLVTQFLENKRLILKELVLSLKPHILEIENLKEQRIFVNSLININTPEDLKKHL